MGCFGYLAALDCRLACPCLLLDPLGDEHAITEQSSERSVPVSWQS